MTAALAAQLAPEVDRVALCIHRPSGRRPELRRVVEELRLPAGSFLVVAARQLADGAVTLEDLRLLSRYESWTVVDGNARRHVELGFVTDAGGAAFVPSAAFREAARLVLQVQAEEAGVLWSDHADAVDRVAAAAGRMVEAAGRDAPAPTPAFDRQVAHQGALPRSACGQALGRVTELRYLRADLHAAALARHDLAGPRARAMARLWKGHAVADEDAARLERRGLVSMTGGAPVLAPHAAALRNEVEAETDALVASALVAVDPSEWAGLLADLARLDGEDPRLPEDR